MFQTAPDLGEQPPVDVNFTPAYARIGARKPKKLKTWMILAPIGAVVLLGGAALMLTGGGEDAQPLVEPAAAPVIAAVGAPAPLDRLPAAPTLATPVVAAPGPAPLAREAAPVRRAAPVERVAPAAAESARRVVEVPAEPEGLRPYGAAGPNATTAPAPLAPAATPRAPTIVVQPLG